MTLFVGGQRHGQDIDMNTAPPTADGDSDLPPSFVDSTTGEAYVRVPAQLQLTNPLTGLPMPGQLWTADVYLLTTLTGAGPEHGMAALQDSVTRWWFTTCGTRKPSPAESNGREVLSARCEVCPEGDVYETRMERAAWMRAHIDATGHTVRWSDDPIEGATDGGQRPSDIQEG